MSEKKINKRSFTGLVVSSKMDKTIVVKISTKKLDPLYKKYVSKSVKYKAHDEKNEANEGDTVKIIECRPISKEKTWVLQEIVERAR